MGTSTSSDGSFSLSAPEGSTLVFSSIGFTSRELAVTGSTTTLNVTLETDTKALSEVVVVGYGTQERGSVTGAISSVASAEIVRQPVADVTQAMQGKVSGVTIISNGGAPGGAAGTSVRIRGITSAGNNAPLYVVDGFPLPSNDQENQLNAISPNDIETIDILKDASATAIYGVRAANGVVIITTKRGKAGKTNINFDAYRGIQKRGPQARPAERPGICCYQQREPHCSRSAIVVDKLRNPAALGEGTDWQDLVFRQAQIQNYSLSATGGSEKRPLRLVGHLFPAGWYHCRHQLRAFYAAGQWRRAGGRMLKLGNSIQLTHLEDRQVTTNGGGINADGSRGNTEYGVVQHLLRIPATVQPYRPDGYWYEPSGSVDNFIEENPLASALRNNQKFTRNRALISLYAELEPLKGLRFRTNVGGDFIFNNFNSFAPSAPVLEGFTSRYTVAGASATSGYAPSYLIENTATYDHLFADKHQVTFLLGQSAQEFNYSNVEAYRTDYLRNDLQVINAGPINTLLANAGTINAPQRLASYFGRLNYEFAGKYLFSAVARYDGSSVFPPGDKFGFFPGVSAGWRISEEEFLKGNTTVSNLKLRAGYGKVGNPLNAGRFAYLYSINFGITYPFGPDGTINTGGAPTRLSNPLLRWETNNQANIGLDLGFLDNRFEASIDLYNRSSPNLIAPVPPLIASGTFEPVNRNAASAYNRGIDLASPLAMCRAQAKGSTGLLI